MKKLLLISAAALLSWNTNAQEFDPTFDAEGWRLDTIGALTAQGYTDAVAQTDNKLVVCGLYQINNFVQDVSVARYNMDGSLDNSFGTNGKVQLLTDPAGVEMSNIAISPSGQMYIIATRSYGGGLFYICRLNANGTIDNSFGTNGMVKDSILSGASVGSEFARDIVMQSDGKLLIAGNYSQTQPTTESAAWVIRYNADGTRDNSFGTTGMTKIIGNGNFFQKLLIQPDGKILAGGGTGVVPAQDWFIARLNNDGTTDNSFGTGGGTQQIGMQYKEYVNDIGLQSDGSIIIGGACGNGTVTFRIIKLTANGMNDANFGTAVTTTTNWGYTETELQTFTNHGFAGLAILPGDKIVIAGTAARFAAVRYDANGDPDNSFGTNSVVDSIFSGDYGLAVNAAIFNAATGRMYTAGAVADINLGVTHCAVAAVLVASPNSVKAIEATNKLSIYPNPASDMLHLEDLEGDIELMDISGRTLLSATGKEMNVSGLAAGTYIIHCTTKDGSLYTGRFAKN